MKDTYLLLAGIDTLFDTLKMVSVRKNICRTKQEMSFPFYSSLYSDFFTGFTVKVMTKILNFSCEQALPPTIYQRIIFNA